MAEGVASYAEKRLADPDLTPLGHAQAQAVGLAVRDMSHKPYGHFHKVYVSPMKRTIQTAAGILRECPDLPFEIRPDIFERGGIFVREESKQFAQHGETRSELPILELVKTDMEAMLPGVTIPASIQTSADKGWSPTAPAYRRESAEETLSRIGSVAESLWHEAEEWNEVAPVLRGSRCSDAQGASQPDGLSDSGSVPDDEVGSSPGNKASTFRLQPLPAVEAAPVSPAVMRQVMLVCHADFIDLLMRFLMGGQAAAAAHAATSADGSDGGGGVTSAMPSGNASRLSSIGGVAPPIRSHYLSYNCAWTTVDLFPGRAIRVVH